MTEDTPLGPLPDPDGDDELSPTARQLRDALAARAAGPDLPTVSRRSA